MMMGSAPRSTGPVSSGKVAPEGSHRISYRILNERNDPAREVDVEATLEEVKFLVEEGYVVRERLIPAPLLERLRAAADRIEAVHLPKAQIHSANFGGLFVRNLLDLDPVFHELMLFRPLLSMSRAVLGPQVQVHGNVLRVSYPDQKHQAVEWHFHQRVVPEPRPPMFYRPSVLDHLIYLDDLTPQSGPVVVLPRTHLTDLPLPSGDFSDKPGQVVVTCPAGSVVTASAALWHRALAPQPGAAKRRLVILGHSPTWMKQVDRPSAGAGRGLTDGLMAGATEEVRELLGVGGYF